MFRILPSIYDRIFLAEIVNGQRPRKFFCNYSKLQSTIADFDRPLNTPLIEKTLFWPNCFYCTRKYQSCISDKINHHLRDQYIQEDQNLVKVNISENESFCLVSLSSTLDRYWPPMIIVTLIHDPPCTGSLKCPILIAQTAIQITVITLKKNMCSRIEIV